MGRDAPADLDALLTSREREVLELLRLGLTNGQIADRLDISVAGVRYHVSEIIGRLGVRNRYEAAAWPARPPWWLAATAPLALFWWQAKALAPLKLSSAALAVSGGLLAAALAGIGLVLFLMLRSGDDGIGLQSAACPSATTPAATGDGGELTVEELTDRVAEAITCPGYAFRIHMAGEFESGPYRSSGEADIWIDLERNQGRAESHGFFGSVEEEDSELQEVWDVTIVRSDGEYTGARAPDNPAARRRPPGCHGPDREALGLILRCEGPTEELEMTVERNVAYRGRNAIAYVATGTSSGEDERSDTTSRVYLDRDTFLPLGSTSEGTVDVGEVYAVDSDVPLQYEFVPLDSLPPDFFDPVSIGYVAVDPEERLEAQDFGVPVYWLGREFAGGDGLPALSLKGVSGREIIYRRADDDFGSATVILVLYSQKQWETLPGRLRGRCVQSRDLGLADRQATIYSDNDDERADAPGAACPPPDRFTATVFIDDTVVEIRAPTLGGPRVLRSPYDSELGMELLIRSLTPRQ